MKAKLMRLFSLVLVVTLFLSGSAQLVLAQQAQPPKSSPDNPHNHNPLGPNQDENGLWFLTQEQAALTLLADITPQATGGPDDFGYTWDDSLPFGWIDATGGTDTGMSGYSYDSVFAALPFSFKYYENSYSSVYINSGYLSFGNPGNDIQSEIPSPSEPNNVVAPYWSPLYYDETGPTGRVYYTSGGSAPNRYFVVEWYQVAGDSDPGWGDFTFEVILYENGDIVFQYGSMDYPEGGSYWCAGSGIEDSLGLDGLTYLNYCGPAPDNKAVRFTRPGPMARVQVFPLYQGNFSQAGETLSFLIPVRNTGELGSDTYDLVAASLWPTSLYAADGTTLLTDTDGDSVIDTGPVNQGSTANIIARVQAPGGAVLGDSNSAVITVHSSLNTSKSRTVRLQSAIPAPFAQVYRDDNDGAMSLYLAQPNVQLVNQTTDPNWWGSNPAVAEAPNGNFVYVWNKGRCLDNNCNLYVYEIEYTLMNKYGETVRAVSKLSDNSGATGDTYDQSPVVAAAPDGHIGVMWYRYAIQYLNNSWQYNFNLFFAVLDATGNISYGPLNLTKNSSWGDWATPDVPHFYDPKITATGDNRFVLAWQREERVGNCTSYDCYYDDIYYAVRTSSGSEVKGPTQFTFDTTGDDYEAYIYPNLTVLSGNRALMTWNRNSDGDIYYAVLDSSGNLAKAGTNLSSDGWNSYDWGADAVQLSDGKVVVGWTGDSNIRFAVLDTNFNPSVPPSSLSNPAAPSGNDSVSVAADQAGHAILTWTDGNYNNMCNLYYALANGNGSILTQPMIFRTSQADSPYIETSYSGYGNTSFSSNLAAGVDTVVWLDSSSAFGVPGGGATIGVNYANHGLTTATGVELAAKLGTDLTYLGDNSGISPSIVGDLITWNIPNLNFLDKGSFVLYVGIPGSADLGTTYSVQLTLSGNEADANPADNTADLEVHVALQVFLPLINR